jgi:hypothetical protein
MFVLYNLLISIGNSNAIEMTLNFSPLIDKKIVLHPSAHNDTIEWRCSAPDIFELYAPPGCS